jgi:hypothetical protein
MSIIYDDRAMDLRRVEDAVRRAHWETRYYSAPADRQLPPTPPFDALRRMYGDRAGLAIPDQLRVTDAGTGAYLLIQGRSRLGPSEPAFVISYRHQDQQQLQLLKRVLMVLGNREGVWVGWSNPRIRARGLDFVEQVQRHPDWYWGYQPQQRPGPPFAVVDEA